MQLITSIVITLSLFLTGCGAEPGVKQAKLYAFGTEINISIYGVDDDTANNTLSNLEHSFSNVNKTWHAWRPSTLPPNACIVEQVHDPAPLPMG